MPKNFKELRAKMPEERQQRAHERAVDMSTQLSTDREQLATRLREWADAVAQIDQIPRSLSDRLLCAADLRAAADIVEESHG